MCPKSDINIDCWLAIAHKEKIAILLVSMDIHNLYNLFTNTGPRLSDLEIYVHFVLQTIDPFVASDSEPGPVMLC